MGNCKIISVFTIIALFHSTNAANYFKNFNITKVSLENQECSNALNFMLEGIIKLETWPLKMLDASARIIPEGLLNGNPFDVGNFDECLSVENIEKNIRGKHCLGVLPINIMPQYSGIDRSLMPNINVSNDFLKYVPQPRMIMGESYYGIHLAFCVPSVCTPADLEELFGVLKFSDVLCRSKDDDEELTAGAIATITFLSIIGVIAVVQTAYDAYLYYNEIKPRHDTLIAFSIISNGRKLLSTTKNANQLTCINGIRALSMVWVVLGHEYSIAAGTFVQNSFDLTEFTVKKGNMFLINATVSVDTFFALAGLVTVYTFLKSQEKGVKFNIPMYYVHRYLRLTPAVMVMALINATILVYIVNGPLFNLFVKSQTVDACRDYWWHNLLYIQNYTKEATCLPVTWYLGVDTQLFALSPLVLYSLKKWKKPALGGIIVLIIAGIISPFAITYSKEIASSMTAMDEDMMLEYYAATHARFGPYVIGMLAGYFIYELKKGTYKINVPKIYAVPFWILLTAGLISCVYAPYDIMQSGTRVQNALYYGFNRNAWGLGVCLTVIACVAGYGGPINSFLSASVFQFIAKISYSIYLVHYNVIYLRAGGVKTTTIFSHFNAIFSFIGDFTISAGLAIVLCLLFESPIIILENALFGGFSKPKEDNAKKQQTA